MPFQCAIVTPSDSVLDAPASYATFQAWDGQRGVAAGASAFLVKLGVGLVRVDLQQGGSRTFVVDGGFAQMDGGRLTLLTERALDPKVIDPSAAQRELADANTAVTAANDTPLTLDQRAALERRQALARAKVTAAGAAGAGTAASGR